jgi:probable HAF family extracellular repeat protein
MTNLGTLPGIRLTEACGLNNNGDVVGLATDSVVDPDHAFLWRDGHMIDLGHLGGGEATAYAISDAGQVVGGSHLSPGTRHAFLWEAGTMIDLTESYGLPSGASKDINAYGQILAGPALWDPDGTLTVLGTLGGDVTQGRGVNDFGQITGWSERGPPGSPEPVILDALFWDGENLINLASLGDFGRAHTEGWGVNNSQQVVGYPSFMYDPDNGVRDLRDLIPPDERWYDLFPRDINNAGQIVGQGRHGGPTRAFLMTPLDGDFDDDDDVDLVDAAKLGLCMSGPSEPVRDECWTYDVDRNGHIDLVDVRAFHWVFSGNEGMR